MNQESSLSVQPEEIGITYDKNNLPHYFDGCRSWPLILEVTQITNHICDVALAIEDDQCLEEFDQMTKYMLTLENHGDNSFDNTVIMMIYRWFKNYLEYIDTDIFYEIIGEMKPESLFGIIHLDKTNQIDMVNVYIMNDFSTKMYVHKAIPEKQQEIKSFCFYEEDFWQLVNPVFLDLYTFFGGWNVTRKQKDIMSPRYKVGMVVIEGANIHPEKLPNKKFLLDRDVRHSYASVTPIEEMIGNYDTKNKTEMIIENDIKDHDRVQLFEFTESYNFANILTYERFQKFKYLHVDNPGMIYMSESELPIEWYVKEDDMRFQKFKGKIWDNTKGHPIDDDHIVNLLNMFHDRDKNHKPKKFIGPEVIDFRELENVENVETQSCMFVGKTK